MLINNLGPRLDSLDSRAVVEERFGPSQNIVAVDLREPSSQSIRRFEVETYHVHRKFNTAMGMYPFSPLALFYEPFWTCSELYKATKEMIVGHHLAFVYDQAGNTIGYKYPRPPRQAIQDGFKINVLNWEEVSEETAE